MKTVCDFCKTEYSLDSIPSAPVQCAVCGHIWTFNPPRRKNSFLLLISAISALLAAAIFTIVVITQHGAGAKRNAPLVATVSEIGTVNDESGTPRFVVSGRVKNQSDEIYGVPNLLITSRNEAGDVIAQQKFMPSATLLDAGADVAFSHTLSVPTAGIKKITVELKE